MDDSSETENLVRNGHDTEPPPAVTKLRFIRRWFARSAELQPRQDPKEAIWGIHWYTPVSMIFLFILGIGSAVGHHLFYAAMADTHAGDHAHQEWVNRIGSGLAFLCKSSLVAVIGISHTQWVWVTLRSRFMTLNGIDALFGVATDPIFFINFDMLRHAKLATLMAITIWIFSFTAILTPSTIWVHDIQKISYSSCRVRSLIFEFDSNSTAQGLYNAKAEPAPFITQMTSHLSDGTLYYHSVVEKTFNLAAYSGRIQPPQPVMTFNNTVSDTSLAKDCGTNCSYSITFQAPAIKCTDNLPCKWNTTNMPWSGPKQFMGESVFLTRKEKHEHLLWVGYIPAIDLRGRDQEPIVLLCQSSVARYSVTFNMRYYHFLAPIIFGVETLFLSPTTVPPPNDTYIPNESFFNTVERLIVDNLTLDTQHSSNVLLTSLFSYRRIIPLDLGTAIEKMTQNMIVSLLSINGMGTTRNSPLYRYAALQNTTCESSTHILVYHYDSWRLITIYATSVTLALFSGVLGFIALHVNGVASDKKFSSILRTTRNPTLDSLMGSCLGAEPVPPDLGDLKLMFGEVRTSGEDGGQANMDHDGHVAMGTASEISPIRKGKRYF